jgi:hypothetical protein
MELPKLDPNSARFGRDEAKQIRNLNVETPMGGGLAESKSVFGDFAGHSER